MKYFYFIFFALIYSGVRLLEVYDLVPFTWMSNYLTDLCAMPLVLGLLLFILLKLKKSQVSLPTWFIFVITAYWSVYFEFYLPTTSSQFTGDGLDVLMYVLGAISFWFWQRKYQESKQFSRQIQQT